MKTAEFVSKGHPDKMCDQISDAILDECILQDPDSRVAIETMGGHGIITITGELTTKAFVNMRDIAKKVYREIGYTDEIGVQVNVVEQSPYIAQGVDTGGAGDQGIMVGYACNDNEAMIPQELYLARKIINHLPKGFGPDAKSQVTIDDDGEIETIVLSAQHIEGQDFKPLYDLVRKYNAKKVFVNPTGSFVYGGFTADTGLTGRKLAVDNYGPQIPIGGGAFSGKDPSKVDRSAAYMARRIAVDYLKKYKADEVLVKLAYSIGVAKPVMATAQLFYNNDKIGGTDWTEMVNVSGYNLTPRGIIELLDLKKTTYRKTAENGHFGNNFIWDNNIIF